MKKGFTLIELLAVIAILAVILLVAVPIILNTLDGVKDSVYIQQKKMLEKAAALYVNDRLTNSTIIKPYITIDDLFDENFISEKPVDNINGNLMNGVIKVINDNDNYTFEYIEVNHTSGEVVLVDSEQTISNIIVEGKSEQQTTMQGKNFIPSLYEEWELGHYSMTTGLKEVYANRIRVPFLVKITPSTDYYLNIQNPTASFVIRSYSLNGNFLRSKGVIQEGVMSSLADEHYFSISLYNYTTYEVSFADGTLKPYMYLNSETDKTFQEFKPTTPSAYYRSAIKSVNGNLVFDGIQTIPLSLLKGINLNKDTYNITTGQITTKVGEYTITGAETWSVSGVQTNPAGVRYDCSIALPGALDYPILNTNFTYNGVNIYNSTWANISANLQLRIFSNFFTQTDFTNYLSNQNTKGKPIKINYILATPTSSSVAPISTPAGINYIYTDGEVRGNIIVEYN